VPLPSRRYLIAALLGLLGLWLNKATVSLLTQETPQFVLGGSVVLISFVALGTGPGILTALLSLASFLATLEPVNLATLVYLVEAWAACLLYRRFGSLIFAEALYWFTGGLALSVLVYGGALGLRREYVTLLFIKQVFNGILNALIAEAVLRAPGRPSWLPARDSIVPFSLKQYVFNRVAFVVMIPALGLAILLTRTAYEGKISEALSREQQVARVVGTAVRDYLTERETAIERLGRRIEMESTIDGEVAARILTGFLSDHPEFLNIGVADLSGRVLAIRPELGPRGEVLAGRSIESRPYFREVKERLRTAYSNLVLGRLHVRDPEKPEAILVIAEPLFGRSSELRAVLFASLRAASLRPLLDTGPDAPVTTTLFDPAASVIASQDPGLPPGKSLSGNAPVEALAGEDARGFSFPPPDRRPAMSPGVNRPQSFAQRLPGSGMGILVDLPAEVLHRDMMPTAYRILLLLMATLALLYAAVSRFASRVSRPLQALNAAANEIAAGRFPREGAIDALGQSPIEEIQNVALHFLGMRDALAYRDALTGLPNRQLFLDRLTQAVAQARRSGESLAVLFLDFDRFRVIEDSLGHSAGNDLLCKLGQRLQRCVREGDTVARLAADEFAVLVHHVVHAEDAAKVAAKLLEAVRPPIEVQGRELSVTASLGIACFPTDGDLAETLLKNADTAMYRAKGEGRDTYRLYHHAMNDRALEQLSLESDLRKAISQGNELLAYYQPLVSLATGRIEGAEALVRWNHPERGLLGAGQFISVAEASGLIVAIDNWMLRTACARAKEWRDRGHDGFRVEVNLSARQFQLPDLVAAVTRCLEDTGLPPEALEIEITESIAMRSVARSAEILRNLRELGVRISLDDFGTGYSSLSYLKTLPVDTVKLDQSFVRDITTDRGDAAIATAIIAMAHSLGLRVVAEGVETGEQLDFLRAHGCDTVQGFLFSRPIPPEELEILIERQSSHSNIEPLGDSDAA
jgi:diguanylate cyclase (GGDEF)-like protein